MAPPRKDFAAFFRTVTETEDTNCWLLPNRGSTWGHVQICVNGQRNQGAHRVFYEQLVGPIPEPELHHVCRNPSCVNPGHLLPVTRREHLLLDETIIAENAAKTHCKRGHLLSGANLYVNPSDQRQCRVCRNMRAQRYRARKAA